MIYLNNAGTSWPKPDSVAKAIADFNASGPNDWLSVFEEGLEEVTSFLGIENPDRFLFTQSCTQGLATAFTDFPWEKGDRLIISSMEHHALSRWMYKLQSEQGVEGVIIPRSSDSPLDVDVLERELQKGARMVAMTMASNVSGEILPFEQVLTLSKKYGAFCLLDGAQTTGIIPINITQLDPDVFVFAGHKGTLGPQGIGGLYISERLPMICPSAACEIDPGTRKPTVFPSYCDVGSAPMMTIAGLTAGIRWLQEQGSAATFEHIEKLGQTLRTELEKIEDIEVVGSTMHGRYTGAVSIRSRKVSLQELKELLWKEHKIKGSMGFQCAPLAHEALGTSDTGTFRFSVGPMNTENDLEELIIALS